MIAKGPIFVSLPSRADGWMTARGWMFTCGGLSGLRLTGVPAGNVVGHPG